ncbi:galactinol synthase 1-like [Zingiber officinale]|uniref:galactinol synthase 1-like n=1 Tax=Zingiber officinale TaxID=94328 RepID=UPI001C4BFC2A|nr:galactinol synthase 1-like [Zingiber officinale]
MAPQIVSTVVSGKGKKDEPVARAYVTFLAGDGDYVKGVVGLAKGLRKVGSAYPLVVAMLPDVPESHRRLLAAQGCVLREIEPVYPPENQTQFAMAYYVINYSKLRIWEFLEYEKIMYLDADIQVYDNVDHLFDLPNGGFYAVMDCFCEKTWSHTPQYRIGYCQQCPDRVAWPAAELSQPPSLYFNAGMFVHEPSLATAESLIATVKITDPTPFAEQDFLNMFFKDVYKPIPLVYNLVMAMLWRHPENVELEKVKVVHYCAAGSKPWRYTGKEANMDREDIKMLVSKWWEVYNDESLDYKVPAIAAAPEEATEAEEVKQPLMSAALSKAGQVKVIKAPSAA